MSDAQQQQLNDWWQSPLGAVLSAHERDRIAALKSSLTGYVQLQVGGAEFVLPPSLRQARQSWIATMGDIHALPEALPVKSHSIDNLLLLHVLEYASDPHQVLREAERVLAVDGTLLLCAFNPVSLWGVRRLFSWQDSRPWDGRFFTQTRIKDWLALLNFDVVELDKLFFRAPLKRQNMLKNSQFMERWGRRLWPYFGAVTLMVATKRTIPLNPLRQNWSQRRLFPTPSLVNKPITRNSNNESR